MSHDRLPNKRTDDRDMEVRKGMTAICFLYDGGHNLSPLLPNLLLVKERRFFGKESSPLEAIRELG